MTIKDIQINKYYKWFCLVFGIYFSIFTIRRILSFESGISILDFEGFSFSIMISLIIAFSTILSAFYLFYKKDFVVGYMRALLITSYCCLSFILIIPKIGLNNDSNFKYKLPLKKIEIVEIEGTISNRARIAMVDFGNDNLKPLTYFYSDEDGNVLNEFPNIQFNYIGSTLKNDVINIEHIDTEELERLNERGTKANYIKVRTFPQGTKVKLKVRTKVYENLMAYINSGPHSKTLPNGEYDNRRNIQFYELSVNEEVLLRKFGIE